MPLWRAQRDQASVLPGKIGRIFGARAASAKRCRFVIPPFLLFALAPSFGQHKIANKTLQSRNYYDIDRGFFCFSFCLVQLFPALPEFLQCFFFCIPV